MRCCKRSASQAAASNPAAMAAKLHGVIGTTETVTGVTIRLGPKRAAKLGISLPLPSCDPAIAPADLKFDIYSYICGLNNMVAGVREKLANYGWHRKQIIFERYD